MRSPAFALYTADARVLVARVGPTRISAALAAPAATTAGLSSGVSYRFGSSKSVTALSVCAVRVAPRRAHVPYARLARSLGGDLRERQSRLDETHRAVRRRRIEVSQGDDDVA